MTFQYYARNERLAHELDPTALVCDFPVLCSTVSWPEQMHKLLKQAKSSAEEHMTNPTQRGIVGAAVCKLAMERLSDKELNRMVFAYIATDANDIYPGKKSDHRKIEDLPHKTVGMSLPEPVNIAIWNMQTHFANRSDITATAVSRLRGQTGQEIAELLTRYHELSVGELFPEAAATL